MIFATRKLTELRWLNTTLQKTIEHQGDIIALLKSELSLREDDLRRTRGRLKNALEKLGDEPPEHDLSLIFAK